MSRYSYGSQMQAQRADAEFRQNYLDARTAAIGDRVPYRDTDDDTDDQVWMAAETVLRRRGLKLDDDGDGYVVAAREG